MVILFGGQAWERVEARPGAGAHWEMDRGRRHLRSRRRRDGLPAR